MHLENCVLKKCTYLPGRGDAMIRKVVFPGEAYALHSGCADPCNFPKCGTLDPWVCPGGGLLLRSLPKKKKKVSPHRMKEWRGDSKDGTLIPLSVLKLSVQLRTWKIQAMLQLYFPAWNCAIDITKKVFPLVRVLYSVLLLLCILRWFDFNVVQSVYERNFAKPCFLFEDR